jgi:hypothetical protein
MSPREALRRQKHFEAARRRWRTLWPLRNFALDHAAAYVAPVGLRPLLPDERP